VNILFVLQYPGYLRYYDSVVHELANRGHRVAVAFSTETKQREALIAVEACDRITHIRRVPRRRDIWSPLALFVRGLADYARFLHPHYDRASYLRRRHEKKYLPRRVASVTRRLPAQRPTAIRAVRRLIQELEDAIPSSEDHETYLKEADPDIVVVSPAVARGDFTRQTDLLKSAHALGLPTAIGVASWDHLTTKGVIQIRPDRVIVWNEIQRREAEEFHYVPRSDVATTGAQPFDRWFDRRPTLDRASFCKRVGLPADRPFVTFLGSTAAISKQTRKNLEKVFVREWVRALRAANDEAVRTLSVLIRPHPFYFESWSDNDLSDLENVILWPKHGANPVDEEDRNDYFHTLFHGAAAVGINTTAMVEAAVVGTPVLTVRTPEFAHSQAGTVHFQYLLPENGGFVRLASSFDEHASQLAAVLNDPEAVAAELTRFVGSFVRPRGLKQACTPLVVSEIEAVGSRTAHAKPKASGASILRPLMWIVTAVLSLTYDERQKRAIKRAVVRRLRPCRVAPGLHPRRGGNARAQGRRGRDQYAAREASADH